MPFAQLITQNHMNKAGYDGIGEVELAHLAGKSGFVTRLVDLKVTRVHTHAHA